MRRIEPPALYDWNVRDEHPAYLEAKAYVEEENRKVREAAEAEEKAKAAAEVARLAALGLEPGDLDLKVEYGALTEVPEDAWEDHRRGKNWFAVISIDPGSSGGLARTFATKARGNYFYLVPSDLKAGDAVEFGADYYTGAGRKSPKRWYGFVVRVTEDMLVLRKCASGKEACKQGASFAATQIVV